MKYRVAIYLWTVFTVAYNCRLVAQSQEATSNSLQRARLDDSTWTSARASAMGLAITPVANGMASPYYNPAGIGGLHYKQQRPWISQLQFPYFGAALNKDSLKLNQKLREGGDLEDQAVVDEILASFADKRQYARLSLVPNIVVGRVFLGYVYDQQVAAVTPDGTGSNIELHSREDSGPILGFSLVSAKREVYLGVTTAYIERKDISGSFTFDELNDPSQRKSNLKENKTTYTAQPIHASLLWQINQDLRPSLALAVRHAGHTKYEPKDESKDTIKTDEDLTLAFSLSPNLGKWGYVNTVVEAGRLTESDTNLSKKLRLGLELTLGNRFGSEAGFSLRSGYNSAGFSYGAGFNLGVIGLNASSFAEDVGIDNQQVIERRFVADFAINVAAF